MPYLGSTVFVGTLVLALLLSLNAWWLLCRALAPDFVARSEGLWTAAPVRTVLGGALSGGFALAPGLAILALPHPIAKLAGTVFLVTWLAVAFAGAAGLAGRIGAGLPSPRDEGREWIRVLRGGVILELTFLLPLLGVFLLLPLTLLGGFGAALGAGAGSLWSRMRGVLGAPLKGGDLAPGAA